MHQISEQLNVVFIVNLERELKIIMYGALSTIFGLHYVTIVNHLNEKLLGVVNVF